MRLAFLLLLTALLVSNTFSPQYLIWLSPFVAFLSMLEIGLFTSASVLTWVYFRYWEDIILLYPMATSLLIIRNGLLLLLFFISLYIFVKNIKSA